MPGRLFLSARKALDLRYGENPHQAAAWYRTADHGRFDVLQGKALSFTNLLDIDSAARVAWEFDEPAAVVIKHTNPCGAATGLSLAEAYVRARDADALSAFGGIVGLNRAIDVDTARAIATTFIEAVIAPGIDDEALAVLASKKNLRVVVADLARALGRGAARADVRSLFDGLLVQERDGVEEASAPWPPADLGASEAGARVVTTRQPTVEEWRGLRFAWRICAHVKSNAVIFTNAEQTLAVGGGQMSRVDAVKIAIMKAGDREVTGGQRARPGRVGGRLRRLLSVPRRPRRGGANGRDGCRAARRLGAGCGGDCGGRRTRPRDGLHGPAALPALKARLRTQGSGPRQSIRRRSVLEP